MNFVLGIQDKDNSNNRFNCDINDTKNIILNNTIEEVFAENIPLCNECFIDDTKGEFICKNCFINLCESHCLSHIAKNSNHQLIKILENEFKNVTL